MYERLTADINDPNAWNAHLHRYSVAGRYTCDDDVVVDAACGIGYGKDLLKGAR
jgi:hypothetical protein